MSYKQIAALENHLVKCGTVNKTPHQCGACAASFSRKKDLAVSVTWHSVRLCVCMCVCVCCVLACVCVCARVCVRIPVLLYVTLAYVYVCVLLLCVRLCVCVCESVYVCTCAKFRFVLTLLARAADCFAAAFATQSSFAHRLFFVTFFARNFFLSSHMKVLTFVLRSTRKSFT